MKNRTASGIALALFVCIVTSTFSIQLAKATGLRVYDFDTDEDLATVQKMGLDWSFTYNPSAEQDIPRDVTVDSENNIIVVGEDQGTTGGDTQCTIFKLDPQGTCLWNISYDTPGGYDRLRGVAVDSQDNIVVVGANHTSGEQEWWQIVKFSPDKTKLWQINKDFYNPAYTGPANYADKVYRVAVDRSDDSIIVVGFDQEYGQNRNKWRVMKFDNEGTEIWNTSFDPNPDHADIAQSVAIQSDGHIIVVGYAVPIGDTKPDWGMKILDSETGDLLDSDNDGTPDCDKILQLTTDYDGPLDVAIDSQDNIIVVGYEGGLADSQWVAIKFDPGGNEIWRWTPPVDWSDKNDSARSVAVDSEDSIFIVGYDREDDDYKWRIVKLDKDSSMLWDDTLNPLAHVDSAEMATGVAVLEETNIIVVGSDDGIAPATVDFDNQWRIAKLAHLDPISELQRLREFIAGLPNHCFDRPFRRADHLKTALLKKIDDVTLKVEDEHYVAASSTLVHDIRAKMDGHSPAKDWIVDSEKQADLRIFIDHIVSRIESLQEEKYQSVHSP